MAGYTIESLVWMDGLNTGTTTSMYLKPCPFAGIFLVVRHGFQDFPVTSWNQTNSSQHLQNGDLRPDVLTAEALGNGVDACGVGEDVCSALL